MITEKYERLIQHSAENLILYISEMAMRDFDHNRVVTDLDTFKEKIQPLLNQERFEQKLFEYYKSSINDIKEGF